VNCEGEGIPVKEIQSALDGQPEYRLFRRDFAEGKSPLVLICGSGLSAPAKVPTWGKLRTSLQEAAEQKAKTLSQMGGALLNLRVESIRKQSDPWVAFKLLREALTKPMFERLVEEQLTPSPDSDLPAGYRELLRLRPRGFVTLNLDKFSGEAVAQANPGKQIAPVYGHELAQKWYTLEAAPIYLLHLHGVLDDPATWVMTQDDLSGLRQSEGHSLFLKRLYTDNLVLFVGVSADDIALSGRLLELTHGGFRPKNLYWLTTRTDPTTAQWAEDAYIKLLRYPGSSDEHHLAAIQKLVADCLSYRSVDEPEAPLINSSPKLRGSAPVDDLDPYELAQQDPEVVRYTLAITLNGILEEVDLDPTIVEKEEEKFSRYRSFCEKYDFALSRAFYRNKDRRFCEWFGYTLEFPFLGKGNFGEVYSAKSPTGDLVAVKIMHHSIFGNDDMLGGFRRGVRSMGFITTEKVPGMVPMLESFEIPPTIVMPFVEGSSLEDALRDAPRMPWGTRLAIVLETAKIIRNGHSLPQTVLHRDVKPSNVMVTNLAYDGAFDPQVIVLDFDMSWHKGSKEKDIVFESRDDFGYLAPEQTDPTNRYAARSTKVDSYGLGMTIYYVFGHKPPLPNEALSPDWFARVLRATTKGYSGDWRSAPARLARLVCRATSFDQAERVDFATLTRELEYLKQAVEQPGGMSNAELWAEEVLAHLEIGTKYEWDEGRQSGSIRAASGTQILVRGNVREERVETEIGYIDLGMRERANLGRYLGPAVENAERLLRSAGWKTIDWRHNAAEGAVRATISIQSLRDGTPTALDGAIKAAGEFDFQ
jgi:eukaryotic-like serine/threonine-protein kinase